MSASCDPNADAATSQDRRSHAKCHPDARSRAARSCILRPGTTVPSWSLKTERHVAGHTVTASGWPLPPPESAVRTDLEYADAAWRQADLDRVAGCEVEPVDVPVKHQRRDGWVAAKSDTG